MSGVVCLDVMAQRPATTWKRHNKRRQIRTLFTVGAIFVVAAGGWIYLVSSGMISEDAASIRTSDPIFAGESQLNVSTDGGANWKAIDLPSESNTTLSQTVYAIGRDYVAYYSHEDNAIRMVQIGGQPESMPLDVVYSGTQSISMDSLIAREGYLIFNVGAKKNERKCFAMNIGGRVGPIDGAAEARMYADAKNSAIQLPTSEIVVTVNSNSTTIPKAQFGSWDYDVVNNVIAWVDQDGRAMLQVNGTNIEMKLPRKRAIDYICLDSERKEARISVARKLPIAPYAVYSFDYTGRYLGVRVNTKGIRPGRTYEPSKELAQFLQSPIGTK